LKYILLIPILIFFSLFTIWPLGQLIYLSLCKTNFITSVFVGFNNYINIFNNKDFIQSIFNSLFYVVLLVPGQIIVSLIVSLYVYNMKKHWLDITRIITYIPVLSAGIIIAQSWQWIFKFEGPINWLINQLGIQSINWFGQGYTSIPVISFIVIVSTFGTNVIIILASILSIDKSLLEAAKIDSANENQIKLFIIIPMIKNTLILMGLLSAINSFQIFEYIFSLSSNAYTATVTYRIFLDGFNFGRYGESAAEAIILLIVTILLSLMKRRFENE
jgi:ABC-type sugar transport system permease subunit